jgi:hypothetical protein
MKQLVFSSKLVKAPTLVEHTPTPRSQSCYERLISYEPSRTVKRLKALIIKYKEVEFEKLIAL